MNPPPLTPGQRKKRGIMAALLAALLVALAMLHSPPPAWPTCAFKNLTGLPCAFCGGTRAAQALLHGDVPRALYLNPLALPAVAFLILILAILCLEALRGRALGNWPALARRASRWLPLALVIVGIWWVPHLLGALRANKSELIDLRNPVARMLQKKLLPPGDGLSSTSR